MVWPLRRGLRFDPKARVIGPLPATDPPEQRRVGDVETGERPSCDTDPEGGEVWTKDSQLYELAELLVVGDVVSSHRPGLAPILERRVPELTLHLDESGDVRRLTRRRMQLVGDRAVRSGRARKKACLSRISFEPNLDL
jgi:hypothetical protein